MIFKRFAILQWVRMLVGNIMAYLFGGVDTGKTYYASISPS